MPTILVMISTLSTKHLPAATRLPSTSKNKQWRTIPATTFRYSYSVAPRDFFCSLMPLIRVLKSQTGTTNGISTAVIMIANSKYQPATQEPKKQPPVATSKRWPNKLFPCERCQNAPAPQEKPIVAPLNTTANTALVRREQTRKMSERRLMNNK